MPNVLRIGTRGSDLALWQARTISELLRELGYRPSLTIIKTRGDKIDNVPFSKLEGKNFFTKELEEAQLDGRVDLAVHSLKDLATTMPDGLVLAAMVGREDARECLLARQESLAPARCASGQILPLKDGAVIGTGAARRQVQVRRLRPDLKIKELRGNVPTRVNRLREGVYDAILLAQAGLKRLELDLSDLHVQPLAVDAFVPAPAQGMLGIQCRDEDDLVAGLARLNCADAARAVTAERVLLERLDGGCRLPFGVNVRRSDDGWKLEAFLADSPTDTAPLRLSLTGDSPEDLVEEAWKPLRHKRQA
ncbi:hydroxymethylbilane synthase [bacterium DOLJORAL78_65_58]|nr:MAG: hydroxymethylbilane synthase [bacterium DOLZORAL124_64_63]PIE76022.1 MAG: hydroxymethylbilane synthase [bacterium DOLJORAL78_65_58]